MYFLIYFLVINVLAFLLYGVDKYKACRAKWRTPDGVLMGIAVIGGSVGAWLGIKVWRHKTMHKKFKWGIPLILFVQAGILFYLLYFKCVYHFY